MYTVGSSSTNRAQLNNLKNFHAVDNLTFEEIDYSFLKRFEAAHFALQIHGGPPQTVKYSIVKLVHNPKVKLDGYNKSQLERQLQDIN